MEAEVVGLSSVLESKDSEFWKVVLDALRSNALGKPLDTLTVREKIGVLIVSKMAQHFTDDPTMLVLITLFFHRVGSTSGLPFPEGSTVDLLNQIQ